MSFQFRSAADLAAAYREGRTTPREVCERALSASSAFDHLDPPMRIFIAQHPEEARAQAEAATRRFQAGTPLGALDGVPVAIKDEFDAKGYGTTCGTSFLGKTPAPSDALVVARLRAAGAVFLGKTNMHEFGMAPNGINVWHGTCRNPYDPARDTGGSSSGSGAAVASGLCPIALGNDGGGSVRVPGSLCGVPSIKGTYDRVPTDGVSLVCWSLEHSGPIGATVSDVMTAFSILTGDPIEDIAAQRNSKLRIGICDSWWSAADPEVAAIVQAAVNRLSTNDWSVQRIDLPHVGYALPIGAATFAIEAACAVEPHLLAGRPLSASVRLSLDSARGISATSFVKAQRGRHLIARDFHRAFESVDLIVTPTTGRAAPRYQSDAFDTGEVDEEAMNKMVAFTFPQNLTGLPAAQVPCGFDKDGMPIGLQIIAPHGADWLALHAALSVERITERLRPRVFTDLLG